MSSSSSYYSDDSSVRGTTPRKRVSKSESGTTNASSTGAKKRKQKPSQASTATASATTNDTAPSAAAAAAAKATSPATPEAASDVVVNGGEERSDAPVQTSSDRSRRRGGEASGRGPSGGGVRADQGWDDGEEEDDGYEGPCRKCGHVHVRKVACKYAYVDQVDPGLMCRICNSPIVDGRDVACGHTFCQVCLGTYGSIPFWTSECPICTGPISVSESRPTNTITRAMLDALVVTCPACSADLPRGVLGVHLGTDCTEDDEPCKHAKYGCAFRGPPLDVFLHLKTCAYEAVFPAFERLEKERTGLLLRITNLEDMYSEVVKITAVRQGDMAGGRSQYATMGPRSMANGAQPNYSSLGRSTSIEHDLSGRTATPAILSINATDIPDDEDKPPTRVLSDCGRRVMIDSLGMCYSTLNLDSNVYFPTEAIKERGGSSGWGKWRISNGMVGVIVYQWEPNHQNPIYRSHNSNRVVLVQVGKRYVPVARDGLRFLDADE